MKSYKMNSGVQFLGAFLSLLFIFIGIYFFCINGSDGVLFKFYGLGTVIISLISVLSFINLRVYIDKDKISYVFDLKFFKTQQDIFWKDVDLICTDYFFIPQFCIFQIRANKNSFQRQLSFPIKSFSKELLKDIFLNLPRNVRLEIHPWFRKYLIKNSIL